MAHAFVDASRDCDRGDIVDLICKVNEQLPEPLAWHRFCARSFFVTALRDDTKHNRIGAALRLIGFFHWLWLTGLIEPTQVTAISDEIVEVAPTADLLIKLNGVLRDDREQYRPQRMLN